MVLLTLFALGSAGWFFYDGYIGYPKQIVRANEFLQFKQEGRTAEWPRYAASKGWKTGDPGEPKTDKDLLTQKQFGIGGVVLALVLVGYWLWSESKCIRLDGDTITSPTGKQVRLGEIRELDRRRWDNKGIVVALFERDGTRGKLLIDDYKYEGAIGIIEEIDRTLAGPGKPA